MTTIVWHKNKLYADKRLTVQHGPHKGWNDDRCKIFIPPEPVDMGDGELILAIAGTGDGDVIEAVTGLLTTKGLEAFKDITKVYLYLPLLRLRLSSQYDATILVVTSKSNIVMELQQDIENHIVFKKHDETLTFGVGSQFALLGTFLSDHPGAMFGFINSLEDGVSVSYDVATFKPTRGKSLKFVDIKTEYPAIQTTKGYVEQLRNLIKARS